MNRDILEQVVLSEQVVTEWRTACKKFRQANQDILPEDVPDEQAHMNQDGSLTIFVVLKNGSELRLPVLPKDWAWIKKVIL